MVDNFSKKIEIHQGNDDVVTGSFSQACRDTFQDMSTLSDLIKELRFKNRFILSNEHSIFLDNYIEYARRFKKHLFIEGKKFYRARINALEKNDEYFPLKQMGAPPSHETSQSRVNPVGIPYLYLASNKDTAISEVRPWKNCKITVAEFALKKEISVVNFSNKEFLNTLKDEQNEVMENIWRELITHLFSMPFDPRDDIAYIPIQYISERLKKEGLDGIIYDSSLNEDGYNLCVFDVDIAKALKRYKVTVNSMYIKKNIENIIE